MANVHEADRFSAELHEIARRGDHDARIAYLVNTLRSCDLDVHTQDYVFDVPGHEAPVAGTNVYARLHTPHTDGSEAMLFAAPWRSDWRGTPRDDGELPYIPNDGSGHAVNIRGISLLLAYAKHATSIPHWSKDYVFVISDGFLDGMQAWATQYFGSAQSNLDAEPVYVTGAQIWNALALDYAADSFSSFTYFYEGRDGQLPNLDTMNTVTDIAQSTYVLPALGLHGAAADEMNFGWFRMEALRAWLPVDYIDEHLLGRDGVQTFVTGWANILRQIWYQLGGHPSGVHGVLLPFHVDAVTLFARPADGPYGFLQLGHIAELTYRSFSNLIERLHHSQFFYLLATPRRFVQIGIFIFVPLLLGAALTLAGVSTWVQLGDRRDAQCDALRRAYTKEEAVLHQPTYAEFAGVCSDEDKRAEFRSLDRPVLSTLTVMGVAHVVSAVCLAMWTRAPTDCAAQGFWLCPAWMCTAALTVLAPLVLAVVMRKSPSSRSAQGMCLHAFTLLHAGMVISVLASLNFAQATAMALILCATLYPLRVPPSSRAAHVVHAVLLWAVTPAALAAVSFYFMPTLLMSALWDFHVVRTSALYILCLGYAPILLEGITTCLLYSLA